MVVSPLLYQLGVYVPAAVPRLAIASAISGGMAYQMSTAIVAGTVRSNTARTEYSPDVIHTFLPSVSIRHVGHERGRSDCAVGRVGPCRELALVGSR